MAVDGYEGRPGAGKTLTMVARAWKRKQKGMAVRANIPLVDNRTKVKRRFFMGEKYTTACSQSTFGKSWADGPVLTTLDECLTLDNTLVLLDEVHMWMPAVEWDRITFEVRQMLAQQRKDGLDFWWTAQNAGGVFNVVRQLTQTLHIVRRYGPFVIMRDTDPISKEEFGKSYISVHPNNFQLYNSWVKVGDGKGGGATIGKSERFNPTTGLVETGKKKPPLHAYYRRIDDGFRVRYEYCPDLFDWWAKVVAGEEAGPYPTRRAPSSEATEPQREELPTGGFAFSF